ncbi:O-methyltransferase [Azospirillum agricola]|uniref:O-methyltransferase n=1 Tax=Azospirillum agricola TaxID=1720247 RepID=UPI000A0F1D6C|nr:class I SAM-dependent methyltransferase [Azospirillum agricola]SMH30435.1 Methyltransferase domain-containing protein [Azospirillum lipoferum]
MLTPSSPVFRHNFHELSDLNRILYMVAVKPKWDPHTQFLFEGCRDLIGQMYLEERRALYDAILRHKPRHCFEIGTFTGGGSTFFLSSAFKALGAGQVVTLEADQNLYLLAASFYERYLPDRKPHAKFIHGSSAELFSPILAEAGGADCVFLDGASDPEQTMQQFAYFEPHFRPGSVLMCHDWDCDKQALLRPHLESRADWRLEVRLTDPDSVGFVVYVHEPA